jgi:mono/diheme cytochrome c family protein
MKNTLLASLGILTLSATAWAAPPKKTPELLKKGQEVFKLNCVACHGEKGLGDGPAAVALDPKPRSFAKDKFKNGEKPEQVFKTISEGITGTPMVAYGHLPEADRWALVYHVLSYRQPKKDKK